MTNLQKSLIKRWYELKKEKAQSHPSDRGVIIKAMLRIEEILWLRYEYDIWSIDFERTAHLQKLENLETQYNPHWDHSDFHTLK